MQSNELPDRFHNQPTELKTAVENIMSAFPAQIRKHTQATIRKARSRGTQLSSVLPVDNTLFSQRERTEFYSHIVPQINPRFCPGKMVPNYAGWFFKEMLGTGGFGEVWLIESPEMRQLRAMKFLTSSQAQKEIIERERDNLMLIQHKLGKHPNIVSIEHINVYEEPYFLVFDMLRMAHLKP